MVVQGIRWVGVATERYAEMRRFALDVLGLALESEDEGFLETTAANGDKLEIRAPDGLVYEVAFDPAAVDSQG